MESEERYTQAKELERCEDFLDDAYDRSKEAKW